MQRHLVEVLGEVVGRLDHEVGALGAGVALGVRGTGHAAVHVEVLRVDVGERLLLRSVLHHHPVPSLTVGAGGGLQGEFEALLDDLALHGALEVQALADGTGGREDLIGGQVQLHEREPATMGDVHPSPGEAPQCPIACP
jgi:hypothetical protein